MGRNIVSLFYHYWRATSNPRRVEKSAFLHRFLAVLIGPLKSCKRHVILAPEECDECGKHHWFVEAYYECLVCGNMNSFAHYETTNWIEIILILNRYDVLDIIMWTWLNKVLQGSCEMLNDGGLCWAITDVQHWYLKESVMRGNWLWKKVDIILKKRCPIS